MRALLALSLSAVAAVAAAAPSPLLEARQRVQGAAAAVSAMAGARGEEAERRACAVSEAGYELLGAGFSASESAEILTRMLIWLSSPAARRAASAAGGGEPAIRALLARAARMAHPAIGAGPGSRSAQRWALFVIRAAAPDFTSSRIL